MLNDKLNKLNCMNYHVSDSENNSWYAQNGLRSLYEYSKVSNSSFKAIANEMHIKGQVILNDTRDNNNERLVLTMI